MSEIKRTFLMLRRTMFSVAGFPNESRLEIRLFMTTIVPNIWLKEDSTLMMWSRRSGTAMVSKISRSAVARSFAEECRVFGRTGGITYNG